MTASSQNKNASRNKRRSQNNKKKPQPKQQNGNRNGRGAKKAPSTKMKKNAPQSQTKTVTTTSSASSSSSSSRVRPPPLVFPPDFSAAVGQQNTSCNKRSTGSHGNNNKKNNCVRTSISNAIVGAAHLATSLSSKIAALSSPRGGSLVSPRRIDKKTAGGADNKDGGAVLAGAVATKGEASRTLAVAKAVAKTTGQQAALVTNRQRPLPPSSPLRVLATPVSSFPSSFPSPKNEEKRKNKAAEKRQSAKKSSFANKKKNVPQPKKALQHSTRKIGEEAETDGVVAVAVAKSKPQPKKTKSVAVGTSSSSFSQQQHNEEKERRQEEYRLRRDQEELAVNLGANGWKHLTQLFAIEKNNDVFAATFQNDKSLGDAFVGFHVLRHLAKNGVQNVGNAKKHYVNNRVMVEYFVHKTGAVLGEDFPGLNTHTVGDILEACFYASYLQNGEAFTDLLIQELIAFQDQRKEAAVASKQKL